MINYLAYLGLGVVGYFFGFQFVFLCNALYNAINNRNRESYYKLFVLYILYSYGLLGSLYTFLLIGIYNLLSDYENYMNKLNFIITEYHGFMKFYDEETTRDPTKISKKIEYWKKAIVKYNDIKILCNDYKQKVIEHKYYIMATSTINPNYIDLSNQKIDFVIVWLKNYLKIDSYLDVLKSKFNELNITNTTSTSEPTMTTMPTMPTMPIIPINSNPRLNELLNMKELDDMIKMPFSKQLSNSDMSMENLDEFIKSLEDIQNINTNININSLKKRKKKVLKKPPFGFKK